MSSGIKKRTGSEYSDGRPGRINYHSEDEYRTVTLTVQATAEDMHDITHLRDAVNELFDGELMLREMRIKSVEVEYESMGQRTGEIQLEAPEYVNGKQIKVDMVNSPKIDDTTLVSTFTVEFETTESPYFETIYTTLELNDTGFGATAEKYGLVDNIDDEKVKYRFETGFTDNNLTSSLFENGSIFLSNGQNADSNTQPGRLKNNYSVTKGEKVKLNLNETGGTINYIRIFHYDSTGIKISDESTSSVNGNGNTSYVFTALGNSIRFLIYPVGDAQVNVSGIGTLTKITLSTQSKTNKFTVYNAGNVTVEPESAQLYIRMNYVTSDGNFKLINKTTGETFEYHRTINRKHIVLNGMIMTEGGVNRFRDTNRKFISLAPGDNEFEITGATFNQMYFEFKFLYK